MGIIKTGNINSIKGDAKMDNWDIFEVVVVIVSFLTGFVSGTWKLSNLMTQNSIKLDINSEKLEEVSKGVDSLVKERFMDKTIYEQRFNDHEFRITALEKEVEKTELKIDEIIKEDGHG